MCSNNNDNMLLQNWRSQHMLFKPGALLFLYRLILFLQQSSVEWCSSLWMHVIQEVDPNFQRTVGLTGPSVAHASVLRAQSLGRKVLLCCRLW